MCLVCSLSLSSILGGGGTRIRVEEMRDDLYPSTVSLSVWGLMFAGLWKCVQEETGPRTLTLSPPGKVGRDGIMCRRNGDL